MAAISTPVFSIQDFLEQEAGKDLLRFSTAGSVDDGKSTLIGRLLVDTQSVYEDQVRSIEGKGTATPGQIDFALLTDGLRAEREQGITIDVAYRYFSTAKRKFIIADTPGHEQYTRNMATGASTADAAVVLIDARKGVLIQSRRHAYIASLLCVRHILVAINKMDLIGYEEAAFRTIEKEFREVLSRIASDTGNAVEAVFIPLSALAGDNVVHRSQRMPWYDGPSLLELLELLPTSEDARQTAFRFPVQRVVRPDHSFRGFAGQIASGTVRPGDEIAVLPSARRAKVNRIVTWDGDLKQATAPLSVTLTLDRELDISRGDLICSAAAPAVVGSRFQAFAVWMNRRPLDLRRRYIAKHASHTVPAHVASVDSHIDVTTLKREPAATLELNQIGSITLNLLHPIAFDSYTQNRATGAFILIDPEDNSTVAAGMIFGILPAPGLAGDADNAETARGPIRADERESRWGHRGGVLEISGPTALIDAVERSLFNIGAVTSRIDPESGVFLLHPQLLDLLTAAGTGSGFLSLLVRLQEHALPTARIGNETITLDAGNPAEAVAEVHRLLHAAGILISIERSASK